MKWIKLLLVAFTIGSFASCKKNDAPKNYSISGKAQKGPLITGSAITLSELNSQLGQIGKTFTSSILSDDGSFNLNNVTLNSNLALLTANGFYFSEIYGELSGAALSLQAIADLTNKNTVNINVLTHVIKGRVEHLVANGKNFTEANAEAKAEFLSFLGVDDPISGDFDNLDISVNEERNAILLSFSIMLQRYTNTFNERAAVTAELTQLLSRLSLDFATDGIISNRGLIDSLVFNIPRIDLITTRGIIEKRYADLGLNITVPNFEKYLAKFQLKHNTTIYTNFTYPAMASSSPEYAPDEKIENALVKADTILQARYSPYILGAIVPFNKTLKIRVVGNYRIESPSTSWIVTTGNQGEYTLVAQRQNTLVSTQLYLTTPGSVTIEYYEDSPAMPTFTKTITVQ